MHLKLNYKPFSFKLIEPLQTSHGSITAKKGWLLRLENSFGRLGWGEVSPMQFEEFECCRNLLDTLSDSLSRTELDEGILSWPKALSFGFGAALAELDGLVGDGTVDGWLKPSQSAYLLPSGQDVLAYIDQKLKTLEINDDLLTFKWKVATLSAREEIDLLSRIFTLLPSNSKLRLDANGGWNHSTAMFWVEYFLQESRIEWFEQPLPPNDLEGLLLLAQTVPVALDESLLETPEIREWWPGWQVRRPSLEGDPRHLLTEMQNGTSWKMVSSSFETGIGRRWVYHLAALQLKGPTPVAPGLAPGWCPSGLLFSNDPELVWLAA